MPYFNPHIKNLFLSEFGGIMKKINSLRYIVPFIVASLLTLGVEPAGASESTKSQEFTSTSKISEQVDATLLPSDDRVFSESGTQMKPDEIMAHPAQSITLALSAPSFPEILN